MGLRDEIRQIHLQVSELTEAAQAGRSSWSALDRQLTALWTALELTAARIDALEPPATDARQVQPASA